MAASTTLPYGRQTQPAPQRPDPCADPAPPCPVCGGLQCLCRPRFFPGQLLSDDDLNRLQQYVIDKNRLHNRHLVGWGVACGLEVACNPCDAGAVTVRAGYALAPCGDDIVVCADQQVDICALIQACRPVREPVCDPPYRQPAQACVADVEHWVLALCYDERPVRGITPLTGAGDRIAYPGCRCGGASGCTCGGAAATTQAATSTLRHKLPPPCEPTQVCEGFRFTAYKAPDRTAGLQLPDNTHGGDLMIAWLYANRARFGPLLERVLCCVARALDLRATLAEGRQAGAGALEAYRDYAQALQEFAADFALHRCNFVADVRTHHADAVEWAKTRVVHQLTEADRVELGARFERLDSLWFGIATECLCSALLPPCPGPVNSNCVPLAVVKVRTQGERCQVVEVCNWQERKLLITWPTLMYWLSWLPWQRLRELIARMCCGKGREGAAYSLMSLMLGVAFVGARRARTLKLNVAAAEAAAPHAAAGGAAGQAAGESAALAAAMRSPNLLAHMLGDFEQAQGGTGALPPWAALAARVFEGSAFAPLAGNAALRELDLADLGRQLGMQALREQLDGLQQTVQRQDELLRALKIVNR